MANEPEVAPGDFLDGRRVFPQPAGLFAQPGVLPALVCDGRGELVVPTPGFEHREQTVIANEGVDDDHRGEEEQEEAHDPAGPPVALRHRGHAVLSREVAVVGHAL